jgi:hypothetical protein
MRDVAKPRGNRKPQRSPKSACAETGEHCPPARGSRKPKHPAKSAGVANAGCYEAAREAAERAARVPFLCRFPLQSPSANAPAAVALFQNKGRGMPYTDDPDLRQFRVPAALAALSREVPMHTFRNWTRKGERAVLLDEDDGRLAEADGLMWLHFRHVAQLAIVAELVALGMVPRAAGIAAAKFTCAADPKRGGPCVLYPKGETLLLVTEDMPGGRIANAPPGAQLMSLLADANGKPLRVGVRFVWLNVIIGGLRKHFGLPTPVLH